MPKNLFTSDEFQKNNGKKKAPWGIIAGCLAVIALIGLCIVLMKPDKPDPTDKDTPEEVTGIVIPEQPEAPSPAEDVTKQQTPTEPADNNASDDIQIQSTTNQPAKATNTSTALGLTGDLEKDALTVIRGTFGNNPDRKRILGDKYQELQDKVNELYREGKF